MLKEVRSVIGLCRRIASAYCLAEVRDIGEFKKRNNGVRECSRGTN